MRMVHPKGTNTTKAAYPNDRNAAFATINNLSET